MNGSQPLLCIKNLSITVVNGLELIKDFNLELSAGDCKGISSPTGTGKSTLFNYIAGILPQNNFKVSGELAKAPELKIAYVFQEPRLIPSVSALKNVMLPLENKMDCQSAQSVANVWLDRFKLLNKAQEFPVNLSGGEKQRVNLARAFATIGFHEPASAVPELVKGVPKLLLLDEPFSSQDEQNARNIQTLIKEMLLFPDTAALVISHDKIMLNELCDEVHDFSL